MSTEDCACSMDKGQRLNVKFATSALTNKHSISLLSHLAVKKSDSHCVNFIYL